MNYLNSNNWHVKENNVSVSLMNFYVEIDPLVEDNTLNWILKVINSEKKIKEISLKFKNLEEAVEFTEDVITDCWTFGEVVDKYNDLYDVYGERKVKKKTLW